MNAPATATTPTIDPDGLVTDPAVREAIAAELADAVLQARRLAARRFLGGAPAPVPSRWLARWYRTTSERA